jgi:hypothetical protein
LCGYAILDNVTHLFFPIRCGRTIPFEKYYSYKSTTASRRRRRRRRRYIIIIVSVVVAKLKRPQNYVYNNNNNNNNKPSNHYNIMLNAFIRTIIYIVTFETIGFVRNRLHG